MVCKWNTKLLYSITGLNYCSQVLIIYVLHKVTWLSSFVICSTKLLLDLYVFSAQNQNVPVFLCNLFIHGKWSTKPKLQERIKLPPHYFKTALPIFAWKPECIEEFVVFCSPVINFALCTMMNPYYRGPTGRTNLPDYVTSLVFFAVAEQQSAELKRKLDLFICIIRNVDLRGTFYLLHRPCQPCGHFDSTHSEYAEVFMSIFALRYYRDFCPKPMTENEFWRNNLSYPCF